MFVFRNTITKIIRVFPKFSSTFGITKMYKIIWTSPTGFKGEGQSFLEYDVAKTLIKKLNKKYPEWKHEIK
jgi:hypothetical protein